ncbi:hypothetical protein B9Z19DRAFT_792979 [Tuber borchii]|uniref:Uncharacterized protein n=1 Tax=Tuber borchii TaxID=42251 RepID=A0A2T6ZWD3_TUBBO|nr:hypothetical protein B9Z19DRAFT_792979 [Tuber borchii]
MEGSLKAVILYIVAVQYLGQDFSFRSRNLFLVYSGDYCFCDSLSGYCLHRRRRSNEKGSRKKMNNNVKGDSCPGFLTLWQGVCAEDRSGRGVAGHVGNLCERLAHPFLYFPYVNAKEWSLANSCSNNPAQDCTSTSTSVYYTGRDYSSKILRKVLCLGDSHGYRTDPLAAPNSRHVPVRNIPGTL